MSQKNPPVSHNPEDFRQSCDALVSMENVADWNLCVRWGLLIIAACVRQLGAKQNDDSSDSLENTLQAASRAGKVGLDLPAANANARGPDQTVPEENLDWHGETKT